MNKNDMHLLVDKLGYLLWLMSQWTYLLQDKKSVASFLEIRGYKKVAIYGFGIVGETLERELRNTNVELSYIVDRNAEYIYAPVKMVLPNEEFEEVDMMIVTAYDDSGDLIKELRAGCKFEVLSMEELISVSR